MAINPLQLPAYAAPQQADFSSLAELPKIYRQRQAEDLRRQTLAELGQGGQVDPMRLIQSGDMNLANLGIGLLNKQKEQERQDARYAVTDARADREMAQNADFRRQSLGIQSRAASRADEAANRPTIQKVKDAAGNEGLVAVYPDGRTKALTPGETAAVVQGGEAPSAGPNNPFAAPGKQTEGQSNAGLYAGRMMQAETVLRDADIEDAAMKPSEQGKANLPGVGKYYNLNSPEFQKAEQAQRNFVNATLRKESGAVINPDEFENARRQYFPAPGDSPEVIAQKRANRMEAIRGIAAAAGSSWRSPYEFKGEALMRRGSDAAMLEDARSAIERGADRKKVMKRLREKGIYGGL